MRPSRLALALGTALALLLTGAGIAAAQPAPSTAYVRLAHLSPDTPPVDVYLSSVSDPALRFTVPGVAYGAVSDYRSLPTGSYTVAMREAGAPADSPPVIATSLTTVGGDAYTVAGTGRYTDLGLQVLDDDLTMPAPGDARIRVVNAAAGAARVDVAIAGGPVVAQGVEFAGTTEYRTVPAGDWTLQVTVPGQPEPRQVPVSAPANSVSTVLLLDGPDGVVAEAHRDSTGAATVPLGSVATGFGGAVLGPVFLWALAAAAGVGAALAGVGVRRAARR